MNHITRLCELACQAYARDVAYSVIPNASILAHFDDEERMPTPRVVFNCESAELDGHADDAVWACTVEIQCVSNADDRTKAAHHEFASEVFSQFMIGRYRLPDALTSAALAAGINFFCQDVLPGGQTTIIQERKWLSSLVLRVICSGFGIVDPTEPPEEEQQGILDEGGGNILDEGGGVILPG